MAGFIIPVELKYQLNKPKSRWFSLWLTSPIDISTDCNMSMKICLVNKSDKVFSVCST